MGKVFRQTERRQRFYQTAAQLRDTVAHGFYFVRPQGFQLGIAEDGRHHRCAVIRRVGPQIARNIGQLAADVGQLFGVIGTHNQCTDPFAVQAEVLRARAGDQHFRQFTGEQAGRPCVFLQSVAKTLVGKVDQWQQFATAYHVQHLQPVRLGQVKAGRVVAAGVQQHHITLGGVLQRFEHGRYIELVVAAHIGVVTDLQPGGGKDGFVDRPGWIAQPDATARQALRDKIGAQAQGPGTARGLGRCSTLAGQQG